MAYLVSLTSYPSDLWSHPWFLLPFPIISRFISLWHFVASVFISELEGYWTNSCKVGIQPAWFVGGRAGVGYRQWAVGWLPPGGVRRPIWGWTSWRRGCGQLAGRPRYHQTVRGAIGAWIRLIGCCTRHSHPSFCWGLLYIDYLRCLFPLLNRFLRTWCVAQSEPVALNSSCYQNQTVF